MKVLDADARVNVAAIGRPKFYVRGRFRMDYAQNLADVARDAMLTDGKKLDTSKWPFTDPKKPILIRRVVREAKDAKTGKVTSIEEFIALDGNHRVEAARILKLDTVPARVIECSDKEAALSQLSANVEQGLFLDRASRNAYIKAMLEDKELKVSQKEVAAITHLTPASINRILKGTQGKRSEASKKAAKAAKKGKKRGARVSEGFQTRVWFAELIALAGDFDKHADVLEKAANRPLKISKEFQEYISDLKIAE